MKRFARALLIALPIVLTACGQSADKSASAGKSLAREFPAVQDPSMEVASKYATGFEVGNPMTPHHVIVFFDPQCPHCGEFWNATKSLGKDAHFTWVPVSVLNRTSLRQGAVILSSKSPRLTMNEHEERLLSGAGGIEGEATDSKVNAAIERNTRLLESFGATGVPFVLSVNSQTGKVYAQSNGMPADKLVAALGWSAVAGPGGN